MKPLRRLRERRATWPGPARVLTSRWIVLPTTGVAMLIVAFVVYGAVTRARPTVFPRGNPTFGATPTPSGPGPSTPTAISTGTGGVPTPTPTGTTTQGTGSTRAPVRPSAGLALPAPGTYAIAVDGSERVRFGPFSPCSRPMAERVSLVVRPSEGESTTSFDFDMRLFPGEPDKHDERHIYRYTRNGVFLDFEQATVTCAGVKQSTTTSFAPPQEKARMPLRVGASWSGSGGDPDRTESYTARVLGTETMTVEGRRLDTYLIETSIDLSGDEQGHRLQRWWYSPALAMPVRWYEEISASRFGATYSSAITYTIVGLP